MKKIIIAVLFVFVYVQTFAQTADTWSLVGAMPPSPDSVRVFSTAFNIGSSGFIGLGYDGLGKVYKDFWQINFDSASNSFSWQQIADFPEGRYGATGIGNNVKGYVGFGYDSSGIQENDFWEYDPISNVWTLKPVKPTTARAFAIGFSIGNDIYIGTGSGLNDFWKFNPTFNSWSQKTNFPGGGRLGAVGFSIGNYGYVGTGYGPFVKNDFWQYDAISDAWTKKADFQGDPRGYAVGFGIGTKGYIGTGQGTGALADFWEYDPETNYWLQKQGFDGGQRASAAGFTDCKKGYIGNGLGPGSQNNIWVYTPSKVSVGKMINTNFCSGNNYDIEYITNETFTFPNVFSVELSDENGNFSNPLVIGSSSSINSHGPIPVIIPSGINSSNHYRMRITSTSPAATGSDNRIDLTITTVPDPIIWQIGGDLFSSSSTGNQWYDNNGPVAGATSQSFTPLLTGDYYVVVTENSCESFPSNVVSVVTGIAENAILKLEISPNPSNGIFIIKCGNLNSGDFNLLITDALGKTIYSEVVPETFSQKEFTIDLRNVEAGVYMLRYQQENIFGFSKIVIR